MRQRNYFSDVPMASFNIRVEGVKYTLEIFVSPVIPQLGRLCAIPRQGEDFVLVSRQPSVLRALPKFLRSRSVTSRPSLNICAESSRPTDGPKFAKC